MSKLSNPSAP